MMLTSGDRPNDMAGMRAPGDRGLSAEADQAVRVARSDRVGLGNSGDAASAVQPRPAGGRSRGRSLRILLAEDSLVNQQLAVALLESEGHAVTVANNGREAVAAAETGGFDLVLMDVQMPEMDGLEATALIRASERIAAAVTCPSSP